MAHRSKSTLLLFFIFSTIGQLFFVFNVILYYFFSILINGSNGPEWQFQHSYYHYQVIKSFFFNFTFLETSSAESAGAPVARSEMPEYHHSRGRGFHLPGSSHRSKCSHESHRRSLAAGLQRPGGRGCCFGGRHQVNPAQN